MVPSKKIQEVVIAEEALLLSYEQVDTVVRDILELHGYDFTNYSRASLRRRVTRLFTTDGFESFAEFRLRLRNYKGYFKRFVEQVTVGVTEMFRDVTFYKALREEVIPTLAALPQIRIWHAGCSTGEEVFSMAILLHEANLLDKSLLYATDINPTVLENVTTGIFPLASMTQYSENYVLSGGQRKFSSYYTTCNAGARFDEFLGRNIVAATNNLVSDHYFDELHLILCRNVLIYFDKPLQERILRVFHRSLTPSGFLGLGSKETLRFTDVERGFRQLGKEKIWMRR